MQNIKKYLLSYSAMTVEQYYIWATPSSSFEDLMVGLCCCCFSEVPTFQFLFLSSIPFLSLFYLFPNTASGGGNSARKNINLFPFFCKFLSKDTGFCFSFYFKAILAFLTLWIFDLVTFMFSSKAGEIPS